MTRAVLFDTETTGLDPARGDRLIEIAAIELINDLPTAGYYHTLLDPERDVPEEATRVHGYSSEDLRGKPRFVEIADDFLAFVGDSPLIAHNARFDFGFMNAELAAARLPLLDETRMVDTLELARKKFPGMPNSLDALCRRFSIDLSERTTHNALLDCRLLAKVYVELMGGRQHGLGLDHLQTHSTGVSYVHKALHKRVPRIIEVTSAEKISHEAFLKTLTDPLWLKS